MSDGLPLPSPGNTSPATPWPPTPPPAIGRSGRPTRSRLHGARGGLVRDRAARSGRRGPRRVDVRRAALAGWRRSAIPKWPAGRSNDDSERSNVTYYVPVNDKAGPSAATLQSCPAITRSKQPRILPPHLGGGRGVLPLLASRRRRETIARPWTASAARSRGSAIRPRWSRCGWPTTPIRPSESGTSRRDDLQAECASADLAACSTCSASGTARARASVTRPSVTRIEAT